MIILKLCFIFAKASLCAFGGAYSFLPVLERELVNNCQWLSKGEFLDVLGMVKIFPGAISIKYASYTGYKIAGIPGLIAANLGNMLAPAALIVFASMLYAKYKDLPQIKEAFTMVQLAVFSMVIAVAFQLVNIGQLVQLKSLLVVVACFILFIYTRIHPGFIIIGVGLLGFFIGR